MNATAPAPALVAALARAFSDTLREWIGAEALAEVVTRNRMRASALVCHSHDFCDANMAMMEACEAVGLRVWGDDGEMTDDAVDAINGAWAEADRAEFWTGGPCEGCPGEDGPGSPRACDRADGGTDTVNYCDGCAELVNGGFHDLYTSARSI